ncbi:AraC family transcriptional regulator [Steroidobacter agaridevorans]|uniref:AraC family transcriptional regulator n=1 Tax=Steroidobacter agaridevorans TaxID=2695856 RepID=A0A829YI13_9GAMM|nr:AraC family transcriptional regulator [Steroidobacter agaridevorans]GFE82947.1 AraC family transcriptional regulator [Steroidobacter agaridevorans]
MLNAFYSIAVRSYGTQSTADTHDFSQLVLPLAGELSMDIAGREAIVDRTVVAYVEAGSRHDQVSEGLNRSLILDLQARDLDARTADRLASQPFMSVTPEAINLIDYMGALLAKERLLPHKLNLWVPLLVDALLGDEPQLPSRLAGLLATVEANLSKDWTVENMAERVRISASRLHAIFQENLGKSPRVWLTDLRLEHVCRLLSSTDLSIAELAYRFGYADQSALTRAMRKATGMTPAAYRRQARARD